MIRFIDVHKDRRSGQLRWGIEPIAKTLGIAPSTYHAAKTRPPSARSVRDAELRSVIARVYRENFVAYNCRNVRGGGTLSHHAEGRAYDVGIGTQKALGDEICKALLANAYELGLDHVIWSAGNGQRSTQAVHPIQGPTPR